MDKIWKTYEDMNEVIYAADMDTYEMVYLNRRARELYGISSLEQVQGKKCYELLQNNSVACAMCTNHRLGNGDVCEWEYYNAYLDKMFQLRDQMVLMNGRRIRIEIATESAAASNPNYVYHGMNDMVLLINECMRMALQESDPDRGIQRLLEYLGQTLHGDRTYIFELSEKDTWNNTYEWCAKNVTAEIEFLQNIPYNKTDVWMNAFKQKQFVVIRDIEEMKTTDPECYEYLESQNIRSIIVGPFYKEGKVVCFYGVDNPPVEKIDKVATMVKTISHVLETMINKRELVRKLEDLSYHDQMLSLGNRNAMRRFVAHLDRSQSLGILYCDVCGLKRVNDTMGHSAGDELLYQACECLKQAFPKENIYRIGGDEMLVMASGISEADFEERCVNLKRLMVEYDVPLAVGKVWEPEITETVDALVAQADAEMYKDKVRFYKESGINRWLRGDAWFGTRTQYADIVACVHRGLELALEEGQFELFFQPQYNQRDRSLYGAETLVRWRHPEKGLIAPGNFIPYLERCGMISLLDEYVLTETCRTLRRWLDAGWKVVPVSVNLSRADLQNEEICTRVKRTLERFSIPMEYVNLEVTESAYMENPQKVIDVVKKFQSLGFKVEMDDFGSGYSSLNSLKDIPVDILKLDMKFVEGEHINERSGRILSSVIRMAHGIGMPVIAEGVETKEQADFLMEIGCFYVQGYYFDRPIPIEEFEKRMTSAKPDLERDGRLTRKNETSIDYFATNGPATLLMDAAFGAAAIIEYDRTNVEILRCNEGLYQMFQLSRGTNTHPHYSRVFYQGEADAYLKALEEAVQTMDVSECETLNIAIDVPDKPFWTRTRFKFLREYDGVYTFYIMVENIDQSKQLKQINTQTFQLLEALENGGAFGSLLLQCGTPDTIPYCNRTAAAICGYSLEEFQNLVKRDAYAAVYPEDRALLQASIRETLETNQEILRDTIRFVCKDGAVKATSVVGISGATQPTGPKLIRLLLIAQPAQSTALMQERFGHRTQPEAATVADLRMVLETIGGAYIRCSKNEQLVLEASDAFLHLLGYESKDRVMLSYDALKDLVWPQDWPTLGKKLHEAELSDTREMELEFRLRDRGGDPRWMHVQYRVVQKQNRWEEIYMTFEAVDDLKAIKKKMKQQEHLDHTMSTNPMIGIVYYHINGKRWKLDYVSEGNLRIFGYTREQMDRVIENDLLAMVHPEDRELLRNYAMTRVRPRADYMVRYRMLNANGEYITILTYARFTETNGELYLCQTNVDLTMARQIGDGASFCVYELEK